MICTSCRRTLLSRIASNISTSQTSRISLRTVATVPATKNAAPVTPPPSTTPQTGTSETTSGTTKGSSQPFSEPFFPSTSTTTGKIRADVSLSPDQTTNPSAPRKLISSVAGGTPLSALTYVKQPPAPLLAREDTEYPSWLWTLVADPNAPKTTMDGGVDTSSMTKKVREKHLRKQAKLAQGMEKPVPMHEQSRDLVDLEKGEGAMEYAERRKELTKSMRDARRKGIREANFLRSM